MNDVSDWLPVHIDTGVLRKTVMEDFLHRLPTVSEDIKTIMSEVDSSQDNYFLKLNQRLSMVELKAEALVIADALPMYDAEGIVEKLFIKVKYNQLYTAEMVSMLDFSMRSLRNKDSHMYIVTVDHRPRSLRTTPAVDAPDRLPVNVKEGSFAMRALQNAHGDLTLISVDLCSQSAVPEVGIISASTPSTFTPISLKDGSDD